VETTTLRKRNTTKPTAIQPHSRGERNDLEEAAKRRIQHRELDEE